MLSPTRPIDRSGLHPGTGYLIAPQVPHGLAAVVEGLTREVLRHRPEDIYVFAARHFEKLLKLREEYHAEEYNDRAFSHEFSYDFNLWPTKETKHIRKLSNGGWSLEREIEILEKRGRLSADVEESPEDVSTDRESRKAKQTSSRNLATTKKTLKKSKDNETTSDARATRIISQMTGLHGPGKNIQTKDIKQELRKNKLSGEKSKATDSIEKGIRGDRRSRTRVSKTDKGFEEKIERTTTTTTTTTTAATTTTTSSNRTSARRSLKKVRRIETESETETEREIAVNGFENRHTRASIKNDSTSRETIAQTGNKERRQEAQFSEHSSERKVSSRALSMDRIRAYVLRKFASTASLEVLRSPTYVEQVQEVIDRAAPIIKKKLEEIGKPRGKRSRSIDLAWNEESLRRHVRDERRRGEEEESEREKNENRLERKEKKEEMEGTLKREETIPEYVEREKKKSKRRSVGSGKRSRRRESGDFGVVDQVDDNSKHSDKLEHESVAARDTLEARLTATQNILEGISKSTSELGGGRKSDSAGSESSELEISDHVNIVSLPIVRPPSSRSTRSAVKNGSDNLTLPPISPEAPKSTKKKDELSLPILSAAATNGNHSTKKQQEDISRDAEEASTMHDITSDIEDIAVLPENGHEDVIADIEQNPNDEQYLTSDMRLIEEHGKDEDKVFREDISVKLDEKRRSLEEFEELEQLEEGRKLEVFRDSLNVTPEMLDIPLRPDSLEPDEDEGKLQNGNADLARENTVDRLKDKLIEIEMAERNIEKALACQQVVTCDTGEMTSQVEKSMTDGKINEAGERTNEAEETMNETEKSTGAGKISVNKDDEEKNNEEKRKSNDVEEIKDIEENKTENLNIEKKLTNKTEQVEREILKNEVKTASDQTETMTKAIENVIKSEDERSTDKIEKSTNGKLPNGIEELAVKVQVENLQSINSRSHDKVSQVTETIVSETDDGTMNKESKSKAEDAANGESTSSENVTMLNSEISITNLPKENAKTKARKKRDIDKLPVTTPLSLEVPFSYVLSEASPCEIPDSVTTVIIPDRPCPSPVILEEENLFDTTKNRRDESITRFDIAKETSNDERQEENQHECGMEAFGEYIRPDATGLSIDIDFMRNVKELKLNQDIIHQNLDGIKEEGEEEEEKEDNEKTKVEDYQEKKDNKEAEEEMKTHATLEDIVEESEETNIKAVESKEISEEISSSRILENESMPNNKDLIVSSDVTDEGKTDVVDLRNTLENSSEESGSTQETHTTTSSDLKESIASNESIESPSLSRPVVPELNLDSLQDNTVSSFKMTANETEKEDNSSLRESDATTSLIEPLTSDERLMNQLILADHEEEVVAEKLTERDLQSEVPEADQLYQAEHAEYKLLEKDPLSTEINLEDEAKSQGDNIDLKALSENIVQADLEKTEGEELGSEEEIAKELISLLDKDMKLRAEESDLQKESKDSEVSERSNLGIDGKSNQPFSASIHSTSAEQEEEKHEDFLPEIDEVTRTEMISKLSDDDSDIRQDNKDKDMTIDRETEEIQSAMPKEEFTKSLQVAPLAQFEQDELLDENGKVEIIDKRITVKRELNANDINIQEKFDDKQISFENANESQSSEHKIEEVNQKWIENEQEEKSPSQEKREQEKLEIHEECKQKKLDVQEEKLKIQEKDDRGNIRVEEEIVETRTLPLEVTESEKDLMKEKDSMKNDDGHEEIRSNTHSESITDDQTEKDMKNEEKEKIEDLSMKIESVHGPITNAISEQSTEDRPSFKNWTVGTKSSTVETVIEAFGSETSADEKMEVAADAPEIIADESLIREKDNFYSAVVKIQACIRGFLARRRMRQTLNSKLVLDDTSSTQKITTSDRLVVPQDTSNLREARRLRREEALKNTTLSLENAFATGRLQHTGEFHDSVPLPLFDLTTTNKTNSITSNECSSEEIEKDVKDVDQPDIAKSNVDQNESTRNDEHGASFHKNNTFIDPTIPIMMHLLADASRHFTVRQNSHSDFNANTEGAKSVEPTVDILMLGYPRNDENQYLNFITSVEDLGSNMDSLTMNNMMKSTKNTDDAHLSTISGEGSLREPLALPGISQGVVIEEVTSLDDFPSESTKLSTVPKTSLDTNSSMQSEECAVREDAKNNLGMPLRTTDAVEDVKQTDQEAEEQKSDLGNIGENNLLNEDTNEKSNEICCDNGEHVEKEKNDKI